MAATRVESPSQADSRRTSDEMMFIGQRCSHDACNLVDFLPLKCQYCQQPYCGSHFSLSTHTCPNRPPEYTLNRVAPLCLLCSIPISSLPGQDPNISMERHIHSECRGKEEKKDEWRRKRERGEVCWRKGCGKILFAKIRCEACKHDFCPSHRYPNQHTCSSLLASIPSTTDAPVSSSRAQQELNSKLSGVNASNPLLAKLRAKQTQTSQPKSNNASSSSSTSSASTSTTQQSKQGVSSNSLTHLPFGARRDAALAAMKRLGQSPGPSSTESTKLEQTGTSGTAGAGDKFDMSLMRQKFKLSASTTDKQAAAELESIFKSLENRHKKGILGKTEQVKYAEMCAEREKARRAGSKEGDCLIA